MEWTSFCADFENCSLMSDPYFVRHTFINILEGCTISLYMKALTDCEYDKNKTPFNGKCHFLHTTKNLFSCNINDIPHIFETFDGIFHLNVLTYSF